METTGYNCNFSFEILLMNGTLAENAWPARGQLIRKLYT